MAASSDTPLASRNAFLFLAVIATCFIWGGAVLDGSLWLLLKAVSSKEYILPGTNFPLRKSFTGLRWPVDFLLDVLVVFFWEAVDGSHPTASALGLYFLAQYLPVLITFYTDAMRVGNRSQGTSLTFWLLLFQACSIGATGPFFALSYLRTSPLVTTPIWSDLKPLSATPLTSLASLPLSLVLGYIVPSIFMGLKSSDAAGNDFQQKAIALWNVFPLWVLCVQKILEYALPRVLRRLDCSLPDDVRFTNAAHMHATRVLNGIAAFASFAAHVALVGTAGSAVFFADVWAPGFAKCFSPVALFIPPSSLSSVMTAKTVGDGVRAFFIWDMVFGFLVANLVAYVQFHAAAKSKAAAVRTPAAVAAITMGAVVLGPGTSCILTSWARDELLFEQAVAPAAGDKEGFVAKSVGTLEVSGG